ncbi:gamma-glutamylaminecyclotransferase isoform X4 [Aplysia californica]|uniref:Gamma-glutamylcyclotransferase family protein n=1 Tax=Aplysia californica TaxID=6500 RepID=A0ABM0KA68_APLCA|nr:gamma-glutamylaminecyclotransferase isoform X4 [Aplysia californica]
MSGSHIIFSYGTLKQGERNEYVMKDPNNGTATFVGRGCTAKKYPLVVASQYGIPFLLLLEGQGSQVLGEVYEVDDSMLAFLDAFESHPDFYRREVATVLMTQDKNGEKLDPPQTKECWIYFLPKYKPEMLELQFLENYTSESKDHVPYDESEDVHCLDDL